MKRQIREMIYVLTLSSHDRLLWSCCFNVLRVFAIYEMEGRTITKQERAHVRSALRFWQGYIGVIQ